MTPVPLPFTGILPVEGSINQYTIPKYQREYSWNIYNWEKLLEDVEEYGDGQGHFMGSIICVTEQKGAGSLQTYQLIDGQQRMTTLSLLLAAIYYAMREIWEEEEDPEIKGEYFSDMSNVGKKLVFRQAKNIATLGATVSDTKYNYFPRLTPSSQHNNALDYLYILYECSLLPKQEKPSYLGNRRLYKAYTYFYEQLPESFDEIKVLIDKINKLHFIHITANDYSDAYMLFETLNNRGVPLTAMDILKSKLLSKLTNDIDNAYDSWQNILSNLPEDASKDRFFRHYYHAFNYRDDIKIEGIPKATASNLIRIYEKLINKEPQAMLDDFVEKAEIYNQFIEPEEYDGELAEELLELDRIGAVPSHQLLLFLFSLEDENFKDDKDGCLLEIVQFLQKYYLRRNITDTPATRSLDSMNMKVISYCVKVIEEENLITSSMIENFMVDNKDYPVATQSTLSEYIKGDLYYTNSWMCRYLLIKLDSTQHSREYKPDLWMRDAKGNLVWTVEHVFPQGENIPQAWIDMIANGNAALAKEKQEEWVHSLGNLTLSGYNSKLSNKPFSDKQAKSIMSIQKNKIEIGYKNGLALNKFEYENNGTVYNLSSAPEWTIEHIKARNDVMGEQLTELLKFSTED